VRAFDREPVIYLSWVDGYINAQDFGEFMKANRLAPVLDQLETSSSSKQPVERGTVSVLSDEKGGSRTTIWSLFLQLLQHS